MVLAAAPLSLVACAADRGGEASPAPSAATPAAPETGQPAPLADGRSFGYIKAVDTSKRTLTFDLANFLTGEEAVKAAVEDGVIQAGESLDNDYYIRNKNARLRTLTYAEDVEIRLVNWPDCCDNPIGGNVDEFAAAFAGNKTDLYRGPDSQYAIRVEGGIVERISEQYLP